MNTKIIASIARNIARLTGSEQSNQSTSIADARFIGEMCLEALAEHRNVVFAEHCVSAAEKRLESNNVTLPPEVVAWAEECIKATRAFLFAAETGRRS